MTSKFKNELRSLIENKVISEDIAQRIDNYYTSQNESKPNRLFIIFGVLGSLLVGLGVILILAHNWDDFPKSVKTIFAFVPLVIGQAIAGYSLFKNKGRTWLEASGTFLFFTVGASIALISQIYNIPGDLSNYLLTWTLLCMPLVYLLKSRAVLILCLVFATYYSCVFGYDYRVNAIPWWYLLLLGSLLPAYYKLSKTFKTANMTSIFNWLFPLSLTIVLGTFVEGNANFGFLMYVFLFGLFYNLGRLPYYYNQKLRRNGFLIIGSFGTVVTLLITSFKWLWNDIFNDINPISIEDISISVFLFCIATIVFYLNYSKTKLREFSLFQLVYVIFGILFMMSYWDSTLPVILINILLLVLGINAVTIGARRVHFGVLNYGLLIITALIICRFFDTDMSFVFRGLLFVAVGVGFFVTNYMMLKRQK